MKIWKLLYAALDSELVLMGMIRQCRLYLATMDGKMNEEFTLEDMLRKLQYGKGSRVLDGKQTQRISDELERNLLTGAGGSQISIQRPVTIPEQLLEYERVDELVEYMKPKKNKKQKTAQLGNFDTVEEMDRKEEAAKALEAWEPARSCYGVPR